MGILVVLLGLATVGFAAASLVWYLVGEAMIAHMIFKGYELPTDEEQKALLTEAARRFFKIG